MPTVAILPVKSFHLGKGRLADYLSETARLQLGRAFAERTVEAAERAGLVPVIVAGDIEVADWSLHRGIPVIADPGEGLSVAAAEGVTWAEQAHSSWVVIHTDLPLLSSDDLAAASEPIDSGGSVIAPSADGGTSVLGGTGPFDFAYGPGSFSTHLARMPEATIITRLGLLLDVDTPSDFGAARLHPRGKWLSALEI